MVRFLEFLLTVTFIGSFSTYFFPLSNFSLFIPVAMFMAVGALAFLVHRTSIRSQKEPFLTRKIAWFLVAVPVLTAVPSFLADLDPETSQIYWLLMTVSLLACRALVLVLGLPRIVWSFYVAGIVCLVATVIDGFDIFLSAAVSFERIALRSFHYNLLGFCFAGFFGASLAVWAADRERKVPLGIAFLLGVAIFLTSSRGSLLAILCGLMILAIILLWRWRKTVARAEHVQMLVGSLVLGLIGLGALSLIGTEGLGADALPVWNYFDRALDLTSPYRGIESGLSGRLKGWDLVIDRMRNGAWLWGEGYRAGNSLRYPIDNGYLVLLFEVGFLPFVIIVTRYLRLLATTLADAAAIETRTWGFSAGVATILTIFLVNNVVARYLFGIGNPFSLLSLLLLVSVYCPGTNGSAGRATHSPGNSQP